MQLGYGREVDVSVDDDAPPQVSSGLFLGANAGFTCWHAAVRGVTDRPGT